MKNKPLHPGYQVAIKFSCFNCGIESWEKPSHYRRKKRHFCSRSCYSEFRKNKLPKEEHNRYGSGLSVSERLLRKKARTILNHAVRDGHVKRLPCEICGDIKSESHHANYLEPLNVRWLCLKHHRMEHGQLKNENPELLQP